MAFGNFTLASAVADFGLSITSQPLFEDVPPVVAGPVIRQTHALCAQLALGINTEKARSEWLIAPVFGELWARGQYKIYVLSGVDFTVDQEAGLSGVVDFMVGRGPQLSYVPSCPILAVVEAKNESIPGGQGQCVAEMVGAQRFNRDRGVVIDPLYGCVTNGSLWRFTRIGGNVFMMDDREYTLAEADRILGIFAHMLGPIPAAAAA